MRVPLLVSLAAGCAFVLPISTNAQSRRSGLSFPALEATIHYTKNDEKPTSEYLLCDGERWIREGANLSRFGNWPDRADTKGVRYISSGTQQYPFGKVNLIWRYDPANREAYLTEITCRAIVESLSEKMGKDAVSRKYQVPRFIDVFGFQKGVPRNARSYTFDHQIFEQLPGAPAGSAVVAGRPCAVFKVIGPSGIEPVTFSMDRETRLLLALDYNFTGNGTRRPPARSTMQVEKLTVFPGRLPASRFELPPGTTAYLPRTAIAMPLPPGVKRRPLPGKFAGAGVVHGYPVGAKTPFDGM